MERAVQNQQTQPVQVRCVAPLRLSESLAVSTSKGVRVDPVELSQAKAICATFLQDTAQLLTVETTPQDVIQRLLGLATHYPKVKFDTGSEQLDIRLNAAWHQDYARFLVKFPVWAFDVAHDRFLADRKRQFFPKVWEYEDMLNKVVDELEIRRMRANRIYQYENPPAPDDISVSDREKAKAKVQALMDQVNRANDARKRTF